MLLFPPMVAHGITDLVDCPVKTLVSYAVLNPIILQLDLPQQAALLFTCSVYHMRKDAPGGLLGSLCLHQLWIMEPSIAHLFLNFIHTPRHYYRSLQTKSVPKLGCIALMCIVTMVSYHYHLDQLMNQRYGDLWWSAPVVSHIFVNELFVEDKSL